MGLEVEVVGETNKFDVIVIGGGIAGMYASVVVTTNKLKSCFLEKEVPGGKLMQIESIHNAPDPKYENARGATLASDIFAGAVESIKTTYSNGNVVAMKSRNDLFYIYTEDNTTWEAKAIIVATGTIIKKLELPSAAKFENRGLSYCILCDGSLAKNKKVVVIGNTSHIDHLKQFTTDITVLKETDVKEIIGNDHVQGIMATNGDLIPCDMIFVQIGYTPSTKFLIPEVNKNVNGEVVIDENMQASYPGIFACGDCTDKGPKLINNAVQQAVGAAMNAVAYIKSRKW